MGAAMDESADTAAARHVAEPQVERLYGSLDLRILDRSVQALVLYGSPA